MADEARYVFRPNPGAGMGAAVWTMKLGAALWKKRGAANSRLWIVAKADHKHWHGATTTTATHIAIQQPLDGKAVEWMETVSGGQYLSARDKDGRIDRSDP
jgi:hypothetical protein